MAIRKQSSQLHLSWSAPSLSHNGLWGHKITRSFIFQNPFGKLLRFCWCVKKSITIYLTGYSLANTHLSKDCQIKWIYTVIKCQWMWLWEKNTQIEEMIIYQILTNLLTSLGASGHPPWLSTSTFSARGLLPLARMFSFHVGCRPAPVLCLFKCSCVCPDKSNESTKHAYIKTCFIVTQKSQTPSYPLPLYSPF